MELQGAVQNIAIGRCRIGHELGRHCIGLVEIYTRSAWAECKEILLSDNLLISNWRHCYSFHSIAGGVLVHLVSIREPCMTNGMEIAIFQHC
jgi:hypothetical protein